jgi:hypothetical protein
LSRLQIKALDTSKFDLEFIKVMSKEHNVSLLDLLDKSKSQLRQDLMVVAQTGFKRGGYFVEIGATDGYTLSNSFLLEQEFDWTGILVEPGRAWGTEIYYKRPHSLISTDCVWDKSNQLLSFIETKDPEYSTTSINWNKSHKSGSKIVNRYEVRTTSLIDLLINNKAPEYIDYLSIDTEGSELRIMEAFDFSKFSFGIISIEHNYGKNRELIYNLLSNVGYKRRFQNISQWDDWYFQK